MTNIMQKVTPCNKLYSGIKSEIFRRANQGNIEVETIFQSVSHPNIIKLVALTEAGRWLLVLGLEAAT